jgi:hypothetical protein
MDLMPGRDQERDQLLSDGSCRSGYEDSHRFSFSMVCTQYDKTAARSVTGGDTRKLRRGPTHTDAQAASKRVVKMHRLVTALLAVAVVVGVSARAIAQEDSVGVVDTSTGQWYLRDLVGNTTSFFYGSPGDAPMAGDWDCDGVDTPGLYRQSDGFVYLRNSNTQGVAGIRFFFGDPGDVPLAGDFDGDGCDTVSIYRPAESRVYVINELGANDGGLGAADLTYVFGNPGDKPFVGDFDGNGLDTVGLHRESTGLVYFRNSHTQGNADNQFIFGDPGDKIIAGDWGIVDGIDTPGLFRPSDCNIFLRYSNSQGNADQTIVYPVPNGLPVAGDFGALGGGGVLPGCAPTPPPPPTPPSPPNPPPPPPPPPYY